MDIHEQFELHDCPYCGGPGRLEEERGWSVCAICADCGSQTAPFEYATPDERTEAARKAAHPRNMGKVIRADISE